MNLFEFSELLRRQKKLLIAGAVIIVLLVAFMSFEYDKGVRLRAQPRYESSIQMAVVPAGFESLGTELANVGAMSGSAVLYATILASPEAAIEISIESGVRLLETLQVTTSGRDGFIDVKVTADSPHGAVNAALYTFEWLETRIATPPAIRRPADPDVEPVKPPVLDDNGQFVGNIRIEASPAFADTAGDLWVGLATSESVITVSLADAGERAYEYVSVLEPGTGMKVSLEDVFGNELDALVVDIPPFPQPGTERHDLVVMLNRGILSSLPATTDDGVVVSAPDPDLIGRHLDVKWQPIVPGFIADETSVASDSVGLLLLTETPIAGATGSLKGPVLIVGALVGGFFALITLAVGVDTWRRSKQDSSTVELSFAALSEAYGRSPERERVEERR